MSQIIDLQHTSKLIQELKKEKKKIVLAGGCFDIIHTGHIEFLKKAKEKGDILIILLESDESIKKRKEIKRPINNQTDRSLVLSQVRPVDIIINLTPLKSDEEYKNIVNLIQPDIIAVTKNDPLTKEKAMQAKNVGGKVIEVIDEQKNSTSRIIDKIKNL